MLVFAVATERNPQKALGWPTLHQVVSRSDADTLELLLRHPCARATLAQRDACDMTPLHIAASRAQGAPCARLLVEAGAEVNAAGPFGVTPRLCAQNYGHKETADFLARLGAHLSRGPLPEMSFRSLLAHLFGISGATIWQGRRVSLESAYPEGTFGLLGEALLSLAQQRPGAQEADWLAEAGAALLLAGENIGAPVAGLRERILAGETVVLPSGLPCHSTACVWLSGRAYWCDRLMCPSVIPMPFGPSLARLRSLQESGVRWHAAGVLRMGWMRLRSLSTRWARTTSPKRQHVGNCAMANAKAALWAVLRVRAEQHGCKVRDVYKSATTYARSYYLAAYIARHRACSEPPADDALVDLCLRKLLAPQRRAYLPPGAQEQFLGCQLSRPDA